MFREMDFMDAKQVAQAIVDGIASLPNGLYLSAVRTIENTGISGNQLKIRNDYETEKFMRVFKSLIVNEEPLRKLIMMAINEYYLKLDDKAREAINDKLGYSGTKLGSRVGAQFFISQKIATQLIKRIWHTEAYNRAIRVGSSFVFNILLLQGVIEEAARASRRLGAKYPAFYLKVSPLNLDMIYFLAEDALEPFLQYTKAHPIDCKRIDDEVCKILSN